MAKVDYLKQLQGRSTGNSDRVEPRRQFQRSSFRRQIVDITPQQEKTLKGYINHETGFYNVLVEGLLSRLRTNPEFFTQLTEDQTKLFGKLCYMKYDVTQLTNKKSQDTQLPEILEPYRYILFGIKGDNEMGLSDKLQIFYKACSSHYIVHPTVREAMALEFLEWCSSQSSILKNKDYTQNQAYKHTPETLEKLSTLQKRHLQIPKKLITWKYDEQDEVTKIYIPHIKSPLKINGDLNDTHQNWNLIIVHQDPNSTGIGRNIHWEIDFRKINSHYLIKYVESANPIGKMESRFVGLKM